jgi:hypothetical protein
VPKRDNEWLTNKQDSKNPDHPRKAIAADAAQAVIAPQASAAVVQAAKDADRAVSAAEVQVEIVADAPAAAQAPIAVWTVPPKSISTN